MAFEFEALVGHLYVVGGRSINTAPPGALCEVSPRRAARGREADTFFTLVLPTSDGDSFAPTTFYEQMALLAAERYFESTGSVTAGLRQTFNSINHDLSEHNRSNPGSRTYEADMLCAVLKGSDLIVGRVGSIVTATVFKDALVTFPEDLTDDEALYSAPMGVHPIPIIKMKQFAVEAGTRVIFGDSNLAEFDREVLFKSLKSDDIGNVLVAFKELAKLQMTLMAVEFIPPDAPTSVSFPEGHSTTEIAERAREEAAKARQQATGEVQAATATTTATSAPPAPRPNRTQQTTEALQRRAKASVGTVAVQTADTLSLTGRVVDHFFGEEANKKRRWSSLPISAGAVVLLPVAIVILVIVLWVMRTGESEYEICLSEAQNFAENARAVVNSESQTVLNAWDIALTKVSECEQLRPDDPILIALRAEGRDVIDRLNQISRKETQVVESFAQARLTRLVAQGLNVYTLDAANGFVYNISLGEDGLTITRPGTPIVRTGGTVEGIAVGEILDIAYNEDDNVLVAVDRQGVVVECSPRFGQCEAQRLLGVENWMNPIAITIWSGRLYILDTGVGDGQIWRYEQAGGTYRDVPSEVFSGVRPVLRSAIDIEIDGLGNIYVMTAEGFIQKFLSGEPQQFEYAAFPDGQDLTSANSMYLDDSVTAQSIYIVNQARRTIYETSLIGGFRSSYRVFNEEQFNLIEAVVVIPGRAGRELIYVASGNTVFAFEKD